MRKEISIEVERRHLIARLAEMDLDQKLVRKLQHLIYVPTTPEPCTYTVDEVRQMLAQQEKEKPDGVPHEEFMKNIER